MINRDVKLGDLYLDESGRAWRVAEVERPPVRVRLKSPCDSDRNETVGGYTARDLRWLPVTHVPGPPVKSGSESLIKNYLEE